MKRYFYFIILFSQLVFGQYQDPDPTIAKLCSNIDKIQSIMQVYEPTYQIVTSPVPPFTGLVYGVVAKTNVVVDLCNFVNDFQTLNTQGKMRLSKNYTNTLTANKWAAHFEQAENTWSLADNAYDFENGESRPGYMGSAQANRDLNEFMVTSKEYYSTHISKEKQAEDNATVAELTKTIANNSILANAVNCPDTSENPNYKKIYEKQIQPEEKIIAEAEPDIDYYKQQLFDIATKFLINQSDLYDYESNLNLLEKIGINVSVSVSSKVEETTKPGRLDSSGKPKIKKVAITRPVHTYASELNAAVFQKFLDLYSEKWKEWITYMRLTKTSEVGLFNVEEKLTRELRNVYYECREAKLMAGVKPESSGYDVLLSKKTKDCQENLNIDEKTASNLIDYYVSNYKNALYKKFKAKAAIWTIESDLLGINRYSPDANGKNSPTANFQSENIKCSDELSAAQMDKIDLAQKNNTLKFKEIIATNRAKQLKMAQSKKEAEASYLKQLKQKNEFSKTLKERESKKQTKTGIILMTPKGSK